MNSSLALAQLFDDYQWESIPATATTAEGHVLNAGDGDWHFPYTISSGNTAYFSKINSDFARAALQLYCLDQARVVSCHAAYSSFKDTWGMIFRENESFSDVNFKNDLISLYESAINKAKQAKKLWTMYRPIQWYLWCAEYYPELGFCQAYALELDSMRIPGNPKGEAVKNEDPTKGPLNRALELQLLINALAAPCPHELKALQERAALALFIAHGRNPANLALLWETDLVNLTPEADTATWVIRYPRIKKRLKNPRDDYREVPIPTVYAGYILDLIAYNQSIVCEATIEGNSISADRPLFINQLMNKAALRSRRFDQLFIYPSTYISDLVRSFVRRHGLISPLTKLPLMINARRLRYTLATNLVLDGISRKELAYVLDHSDQQHVEVYFDLAGEVVEHLDKAYFSYYAQLAKYFKGKVVSRNDELVNGDDESKLVPCIDVYEDIGVCGLTDLCHLYPPYSCYKCPKFQAYKDADHEAVFEFLLQRRVNALATGDKQIAVQLDEIMLAVQQVVQMCKSDVAMVNA
jgi:hypothetical protein